MSIRCPHPNCGNYVEELSTGGYPSRCPHCGLLLQNRQRPARRVRASGQESGPEPRNPDANTPARRGFVAELADADACKTDRATDTVNDESAANHDFPFGAEPVSLPASMLKRRRRRIDLTPWIIVGLLVVGVGAAIVFLSRGQFIEPRAAAPAADGPIFQNVSRNYSIQAPNNQWKTSASSANQEKLEVALERREPRAWITVASGPMDESIASLGHLADTILAELNEQMVAYSDAGGSDAMLGGRPARKLSGTAEYLGSGVRVETFVMSFGGLWYRVMFLAPREQWESAVAQFELARESFAVLNEKPTEVRSGESEMRAFASKKFPYRIRASRRTWRETPELDTGSRFADLKLTDKNRQAQVVVSPRETADLSALEAAYLARQKKTFAKVAIREGAESLEVRGHPALRVKLLAEYNDDRFLLLTTFVRAGKFVYQIECRAPAAAAAEYEPLFVRLIDGFEVVERAPSAETASAVVAESDKTPSSQKKVAAPTKADPKTVGSPIPRPTAVAEKSADQPAAASKPGAKEPDTKNPPADKTTKQKPGATKKTKSLDDID